MPTSPQRRRLPQWLKAKAPGHPNYVDIKHLVADLRLNTVCESAQCPNIGECWGQRTATFMILGDICTRSSGFCAIKTGRPVGLDEGEPERVAAAIAHLDLRHAVITSVNRDELPDGGTSGQLMVSCMQPDRGERITVEPILQRLLGLGHAQGSTSKAAMIEKRHLIAEGPGFDPRACQRFRWCIST